MVRVWNQGFWNSGSWNQEIEPESPRKKMKSKLGLSKLNHDELADTGDSVHTGMTTNAATFPAANPTMPALATKLSTLRTRMAARVAGEAALAALVQAENASAEDVRGALSMEMTYVDFVAAGNPATILLANMSVRRDRTPVGPMPKVLNVKTTPSDYPGQVDVMWPPITGASAFALQTCTADPGVEANWHHADMATKSSATLKGLATGRVWVRVCAKGADDLPGPFSDPAQEIVR